MTAARIKSARSLFGAGAAGGAASVGVEGVAAGFAIAAADLRGAGVDAIGFGALGDVATSAFAGVVVAGATGATGAMSAREALAARAAIADAASTTTDVAAGLVRVLAPMRAASRRTTSTPIPMALTVTPTHAPTIAARHLLRGAPAAATSETSVTVIDTRGAIGGAGIEIAGTEKRAELPGGGVESFVAVPACTASMAGGVRGISAASFASSFRSRRERRRSVPFVLSVDIWLPPLSARR